MDDCLETRASKVVDRRLDHNRRHDARRPEDATEDKGEVYDVSHHKADLLLAKERVEACCVKQWMKGALTYSRDNWPTTELPSPKPNGT